MSSSLSSSSKEILWEKYHEELADKLFVLADEISQSIIYFYQHQRPLCKLRLKRIKDTMYNEWGITEDMLHITVEWGEDYKIVIRNPEIDGSCSAYLKQFLQSNSAVQRFVALDNDYAQFVQNYSSNF